MYLLIRNLKNDSMVSEFENNQNTTYTHTKKNKQYRSSNNNWKKAYYIFHLRYNCLCFSRLDINSGMPCQETVIRCSSMTKPYFTLGTKTPLITQVFIILNESCCGGDFLSATVFLSTKDRANFGCITPYCHHGNHFPIKPC